MFATLFGKKGVHFHEDGLNGDHHLMAFLSSHPLVNAISPPPLRVPSSGFCQFNFSIFFLM